MTQEPNNNENKKRPMEHIKIVNSNLDDNTYDFREFIAGLVRKAGEDARPANLDFSLIHIDNNGEKTLLSLPSIPIVPPIFDPNPYPEEGLRERNYKEFLFNPVDLKNVKKKTNEIAYRSVDEIKSAYENLSQKERKEYIACSADLIIAYILGEIGLRYIKASIDNDKETMQQLQDFQIVDEEGFDLEMFETVMRTPGGLKRENGTARLEYEKDGKQIILFPDEEEIAKYKMHQNFRDHCLDAGAYFVHTLADDLEVYPRIEDKINPSAPSGLGE